MSSFDTLIHLFILLSQVFTPQVYDKVKDDVPGFLVSPGEAEINRLFPTLAGRTDLVRSRDAFLATKVQVDLEAQEETARLWTEEQCRQMQGRQRGGDGLV